MTRSTGGPDTNRRGSATEGLWINQQGTQIGELDCAHLGNEGSCTSASVSKSDDEHRPICMRALGNGVTRPIVSVTQAALNKKHVRGHRDAMAWHSRATSTRSATAGRGCTSEFSIGDQECNPMKVVKGVAVITRGGAQQAIPKKPADSRTADATTDAADQRFSKARAG